MTDKTFELKGVFFVWDQEKARTNALDHDGITFEEAAEAFFDPFMILEDATRDEDEKEERDAAIGYGTKERLLYVVHVEVEETSLRIISARKAEPPERERYDSRTSQEKTA
jgi:uncharacterized DUF497 family protein